MSTAGCADKPISIHALRVEGDPGSRLALPEDDISIHALRVEGDGGDIPDLEHPCDFYPRPPGGGRRICRTASL